MAGALINTSLPILRPLTFQNIRKPGMRISASSSEQTSPNSKTRDDIYGAGVSTSNTSNPKISPPANLKQPEPKPFTIQPDRTLDILGASLSIVFRLGTGIFNSGCPFCRKVREIVAVLDIDVLFYPCPRNGPNFRPIVAQMGGKQMFPYMIDPNTGVAMYESDDIIKYLVDKYGDGQVPLMLSLGPLTTLAEGFAMIGRTGRGQSYSPAKMPSQPLVIWAYEGSPFCKVVREVLVELELPHIQRSCARGSPKRQELYPRVGHFQVPYLEDPNTGVQMFESAAIVDYLKATYAL